MGISKDFSVVADSEMASSPGSLVSSPAPIKRTARIYGRRREEPDISFTSEQDSRDSILLTGPPNLSDEVPPSEPSGLVDSDEEGEDSDGDILPSSLRQPHTGFGWREKMQEIDDRDDLSGYIPTHDTAEHASEQECPPTALAPVDNHQEPPCKVIPSRLLSDVLPENVSDGSLSQAPASRDSPSRASSPKASSDRLRARKNIIISDDDSCDEGKRSSRSSSHSPSLNLLATPNSHRTSSPPTSHHDDVSANSAPSSASKEKGKDKQMIAPFLLEKKRAVDTRSLEDATRSRSGPGRKEKIKPPTKKERREMVRERARLAAGQEVSINKLFTEEKSIRTFLTSVQAKFLSGSSHAETSKQPSSPINDFSSSQPHPHNYAEAAIPPTPKKHLASASRKVSPRMQPKGTSSRLGVEESDSDGPPNIGTVPGTTGRKPIDEAASKEQALRDHKLRILRAQPVPTHGGASDSDLEVVPPTKLEQQRKSAEQMKMSSGQRMFLANAHAPTRPVILNHQTTKEELEAVQNNIMKTGIRDPRAFRSLTRRAAENASMGIIKQKEEMWKQLGGTLKEHRASASAGDIMRNQIQKGLEVWTKQSEVGRTGNGSLDDNGDGEEDSDWTPAARGSMSPSPLHGEDEHIDYERMEMGEMNDDFFKDQDAQEFNSNGDQSDDEKDQAPDTKVKSKRRHHARIIDSDQSDAEGSNTEDSSIPKPRVNHYLVSSSDDRTEDENDKENDTRLMFDRGEDKENKAVIRHEPLPNRSIFDEMEYDLSLSPPHVSSRGIEQEDRNSPQATASPCEKRQPFGVISVASSLSLQRQPSTLTQAFAAQLKHSSPTHVPVEDNEEGDVFGSTPSAPAASLTLVPVFGGKEAGEDRKSAPLGFSQDESGSMSFGAPALLQPGFSDLFESSTQKDDTVGALQQDLRRQDSLGLTQDLVLQPAFQVDGKLLRKANAIFEKEQEYVVEAASKKGTKALEFYVNEVGLLTQTKPSASRLGTRSPSFAFSPGQTQTQHTPSGSSLVYTQLLTQRQSSDPTQRPPLSTISLLDPSLNSPETNPKHRRIYRRRSTPALSIGGSPTHTPTPSNTLAAPTSPRRSLNAFELLGKGAANAKVKERVKIKNNETEYENLIRKEYLNDEAEESDEDRMTGFGFGLGKGGGEEGEGVPGEDLDAHLAELVDDWKMDQETEAADRVLEKHQEMMEEDDQKLEELHKRAVQGELRRKRKKNGLGMDDSDDDDEEEDSRLQRLRKKMKSKVERGDIQELAANEDTAAFAKIYQSGLVDDEMIETRPLDLEHDFETNRDLEDQDTVMSDSQEYKGVDQDQNENEDEEEAAKNNFVTFKEIQQQVRKIKEQPEEVDDYKDSSWIDEQIDGDDRNEDSSLKVSLIKKPCKKIIAPTTSTNTIKPEWDSIIGGYRQKENAKDIDRSRQWAKQESRNMHGLTGRKVGGIAVTGHGNGTKSGGGSLRSKPSVVTSVSAASSASASSSNLGEKRSFKAEASVLAQIGRRDFQ